MGQTLTHGIYLPDEGERNCYDGLAGNWQILDNSVGTVAEHSTQIAGKAPLVHTHTKADITDFPVYGTTAGTICEGNDSRLSDARTPVAHTHTKSDVTDLFNSANTWTALNSYNQSIQITANFSIGAAPSSDVYGGFNFGNGSTNIGNVTARVSSAGITYSRLYVSNKYANGALDPNGTLANVELQVGLKANGNRFIYSNASWGNSLVPYDNNTYNLGSSSYQWNNLYAKSYYYNGVAWGLDQANVWSKSNTYSGNVSLYNSDNTQNTPTLYLRNSKATILSSGNTAGFQGIYFTDSNNSTLAYIRGTVQSNGCVINLKTFAKGSNNNTVENGVQIGSFTDGSKWVAPTENGTIALGGANKKWKTLNGINPGALSLPDYSKADILDVSAQGLNWDLTGATSNSYTPTFDGYLSLRCKDTNGDFLFAAYGGSNAIIRNCVAGTGVLPGNAGLCLLIPMQASTSISIQVKATANFRAYIIPCFGNV